MADVLKGRNHIDSLAIFSECIITKVRWNISKQWKWKDVPSWLHWQNSGKSEEQIP